MKKKNNLIGFVGDVTKTSLITGASSLALGSLNSPVAVHGQTALVNSSRFYGTMGTVVGVGETIKLTKKLGGKKYGLY